jgi:hypothetical protein
MRKRLAAALFIFLGAVGGSWAQGPVPSPETMAGLVPNQKYHGGDIDSVNLTNGGLTVQIPLVSYPQRGGKLRLEFVLTLNTKSLQVVPLARRPSNTTRRHPRHATSTPGIRRFTPTSAISILWIARQSPC